MFGLCYILQIINDLGINAYNTREVAQNQSSIPTLSHSKLFSKFLLSGIYVLIVLFTGLLLGYGQLELRNILLIALNLVVLNVIFFLRSFINGSGYHKIDGLVSIIDKLILIPLLAYFLFVNASGSDFSILQFILCQSFSLVIALLFALIVVLKKNISPSLSWDLKTTKACITKSLPFALVVILMSLYTRMDGVMLERLLDDNGYQAGVYAASFRLFDAANILGFLVAGLLLPLYSKTIKEKGPLNSHIHIGLKLICFIAFIGGSVLVFYRAPILNLLYIDSNDLYYPVLMYLGLAYIFIMISYAFGTALVANNTLKEINVVFALGVLLNLGLNLWLIPIFFAEGAAIATLITQGFAFVGQMYFANRLLVIKWSLIEILQLAFFGLLCAIIFYTCAELWSIYWMISLLTSIILCIVLSFILGFWRKSPINSLLSDKF